MYSRENNIGTVAFLIMVMITIVVWIGAEYFHSTVNKDEIDPLIQTELSTSLPPSIDTETLNNYYSVSSSKLERL